MVAAWAVALGSASAVVAQSPADTVQINSGEVVAIRRAAPVFAPVHALNVDALRGAAAVDVEGALNQIPGVKMETRGAGGSRRLQMRGSSLRSPFGVRNVFLLLDGFVLTTADGESPLEWLDPELLGGIEAMTGPSGAVLGGGYAGALWARHAGGRTGGTVRLASLGRGAAGGAKPASFVAAHAANGNWCGSILASQHPGYRLQESNAKWQGDLHWRASSPSGRVRHLWVGAYDGSWDLPGSLDAETQDATPTAAPGEPFDARVERRRLAFGWSSTWHSDPQQGWWLLATATDKHNPYGTSPFYNGNKFERAAGASLRWARSGMIRETARSRWTWQAQSIAQADATGLEEWAWESEEVRYDLLSEAGRGWATASIRQVTANGIQWHAGFAANGVLRHTTGSVKDSLPYSERFNELRPLPRFGVLVPLGPKGEAFAEWGTGGSTPTTFELVDPVLLVAYDLKSERGQALEAGFRWRFPSLEAEASAYQQGVWDAISMVPGPTDALILANADFLKMRGVEFAVSGRLFQEQVEFSAWSSLNRYEVQSMGWAGTFAMPGTPLHAAGGTLVAGSKHWKLQGRWRWNDRAPLNDWGTDWAPAHHRLDATVSYRMDGWTVQFSALNATNSAHSDWYQANAFGGKYYNPVAPRQWEVSVRWERVTR